MKDASTATVAGTILVVAEIPNLYSGLLPSMFTISSPFFHEQGAREGNVKRIRQGELIATGFSLALGIASATLFESPLPLLGTVAMVVVLLACYEYALRNPATQEGAKA